jgi:hypothetical protein
MFACRRQLARASATLLVSAAVVAVVAGCANHSPGGNHNSAFGITLNPQPAWARAMGSGVVVVAPAVTPPGHGSPGAVVRGFFAAVDSHQLIHACPYFPPDFQAQCLAEFNSPSPPTVAGVQKGFMLGYAAIDGNKALVVTTATDCSAGRTPACSSNANSAALFSRGKTFAALWNETLAQLSNGKGNWALYPCVLVSGRWYLYSRP